MDSVVHLSRGEAVEVRPAAGEMWTVFSGKVLVYAVASGENGGGRAYLAQVEAGGRFLSPVASADFHYRVQAVETADLAASPLPPFASERLDGVENWFRSVARSPWMKDHAGADDHAVPTGYGWRNRDLARALDRHFASRDASFERRIEEGRRHKRKMLAGTFGHLLRSEYPRAGIMAASIEDDGQPARRAVKLAAGYFNMDASAVFVSDEVAASLSPDALLHRLADKAGLRLRRVTLPEGWRKDDAGPLICRYGPMRKLGVLLPRRGGGYRLYLESYPEGLIVDRAVAGQVHDDAYACYAGLPFESMTVGSFLRAAFRRIWLRDWGIVLFTTLLASLAPIALPLIIESIFQDIIPIQDRKALGTLAQVMLAVGFAQAVFVFVRAVSCIRMKNHAAASMEGMLWSRLIGLPTRFFRDYQVGDLVNRMDGIANISNELEGNFLASVFALASIVWTLLLMLDYSVRLTLFTLVVGVLSLLFSIFLYRNLLGCKRNAVQAANRLTARTLQLISGIHAFRIRGAEERALFLWSRLFGEGWEWNLALRRRQNRIGMFAAAQPIVLSMVVFYVTKHMFFDDDYYGYVLTYTEFLAFIGLYAFFNASVMQIVPLAAVLYGLKPQLENLEPILAAEPEATASKTDSGLLAGRVEMKDVHFGYGPDSPPVLVNVGFAVQPGRFVAVVGASGSGKSTLIRLLLGFEKPIRGGVFYDGQDLDALNIASVRSQIGVVLQGGQLIAGDIFSNIAGSLPLSMDDAWEAAAKADLAADVKAMPMGMRTIISEGGGNVSGGQKQRILLARAIVNRPRVVILDEATSSLDNLSQRRIMNSLAAMNVTRIVAAHRLSTVRLADEILVLERGRIVQRGSYDKLMAENGAFAERAGRQLT